MLHRLILMRHATTAPQRDGGDHARPLTSYGEAEAREMGAQLREWEGSWPPRVFSSSARRTRETLALLELPGASVALCDGGFLDFEVDGATVRFDAAHPVFGTIHEMGEFEDAMGELAETGSVTLAPNPAAAVADWWRGDLFDSRLRVWMGEIDADGFTVSNAELLKDLIVDDYERVQRGEGSDLLRLDFIGRQEKLFLVNEGNVCSDRFHQTVFPGERPFAHCTGLQGYVPWGTEAPPRGGSGRGSGAGRGGFGNGGGPKSRRQLY